MRAEGHASLPLGMVSPPKSERDRHKSERHASLPLEHRDAVILFGDFSCNSTRWSYWVGLSSKGLDVIMNLSDLQKPSIRVVSAREGAVGLTQAGARLAKATSTI
ncbi:hypothetical protein EVAR_24942_1 [Eumeta japonica]|uniref:Uncharacterized protein n=1 Tax=Eumeta variegata TaxID=151549 RepID=A0A4C2A202_EUMVA|nr:hypothetical protein EVAR_24942_1 [Eumeta japonica]